MHVITEDLTDFQYFISCKQTGVIVQKSKLNLSKNAVDVNDGNYRGLDRFSIFHIMHANLRLL